MFWMKQRCVTLIEIIVVIALIGIIAGALAYNFRGSLEEGKAFKTQVAMEKLQNILTLAVAEDPELGDNLESNWESIVQRSPLVKNPRDVTHDGWGEKFQVSYDGSTLTITSEPYARYKQKKQK